MEVEVRICILDNKEVKDSEYYFMIASAIGIKYANSWTKTIRIPLGKVDDG